MLIQEQILRPRSISAKNVDVNFILWVYNSYLLINKIIFMLEQGFEPSDKNDFHFAHVRLPASSFELLTGKNFLASSIENLSREWAYL